MVKEGDVYYSTKEKTYFKIIKPNNSIDDEPLKGSHKVGWAKRSIEDALKTNMTWFASDKYIKKYCKKINLDKSK